MSIIANYNTQQDILSLKIEGYITIEDIEQTTLNILNSEEFSRNVNTLWDIRELSFENIDITFLRQVVALRKKYNGKRGEAKIAILSNYFLGVPIVKLYMILSKGLSQKNNTFHSIKDAERWLSNDLLKSEKPVGKLN
jgi:uncharacterized protein (UPF0335 family)